MNDEDEFQANELLTAIDGNGFVLLSFRRDSGDTRDVVVRQSVLPQMISQLQTRIAPGQGAPIDLASFRAGRSFALRGMEARGGKTGANQLTLFVEPEPGRVVSIPIDLSDNDRASLLEMLGQKKRLD